MSGVYFIVKIDARYCTLEIRGGQLLEADNDIDTGDFKRRGFGILIFSNVRQFVVAD
jgi:hypothetical protein